MFDDIKLSKYSLVKEKEWKSSYKLMKEYEMLGFYLSGHPLEVHKNYNSLLLREFIEVNKIQIFIIRKICF